jgi:hypothetical protein
MMMKSVILVCALAMPRGDCNLQSAEAVIQGPDAAHPGQCGLYSQAYLAETPLADYLDGQHYLKITCTSKDRRLIAMQRSKDKKDVAAAQSMSR